MFFSNLLPLVEFTSKYSTIRMAAFCLLPRSRGLKKNTTHTKFFRSTATPKLCTVALYTKKWTEPRLIKPSQTPPTEDRKGHGHYFTPARAKLRGAVRFCKAHGHIISQGRRISNFQCFPIARVMSSYAITRLRAEYTIIHLKKNLVGVADLSVQKKIREMERILQEEGIEARAMTREQLGYEVGLECRGQTVKNAMGCLNYWKCISCKKS